MEILQKSTPLLLSIFLVAALNWYLPQLYVYLCIPEGFIGFLQSIITTASPICQGILTIINHSNTIYTGLIATGTALFINNVLILFK
ncbi:MAG: hypothetical protein EBT86_00045 [Actinobacteria bacterium]|nr:hypothetical protein [Actinomycetota bacterium]